MLLRYPARACLLALMGSSMDVKEANDLVTSEPQDQFSTAGLSDGLTTAAPFSETPEPLLGKGFAMVKGDGVESYSKNSRIQASVNKIPLLALNEALEKVSLPSKGDPVVVADLGCSSGPNTIGCVAFIVDNLRHRLPSDAQFQAYFNDLPSNDFNNLFQLLSTDTRAKNIYAAGVPGSYLDRLFPDSSVHVFNSSNCLHWLSKIPDAVLDKDSPAYNRGHPWIVHSRSAVAESYQQQASSELKNFLLARGAELASGGLLFLHFNGRETNQPNEPFDNMMDKFAVDLDKIGRDLIAEGLLSEQQLDTFNIPMYERGIGDIREAMTSCGSLFHVLTAKLHRLDLSAIEIFGTTEPTELSKRMSLWYKALMNDVFEAHVGKEVSEVIWQRYQKLVETKIRTSPQGLIRNSQWTISLTRK